MTPEQWKILMYHGPHPLALIMKTEQVGNPPYNWEQIEVGYRKLHQSPKFKYMLMGSNGQKILVERSRQMARQMRTLRW
jgi:hypothetical protein